MPATASLLTTPHTMDSSLIDFYQQHGCVKIPGIIPREEALQLGEASLSFSQKQADQGGAAHEKTGGQIFSQHINVWREDPALRQLTLHDNLAAVATKLAGGPLRLWHDHMLIKAPHNNAATEFHQDQPYWPHANSTRALSAWVALCDVPVEKGCMTFVSGTHSRTDLPRQMLSDDRSLFSICPELEWTPRVTLPLQAGDCTFHHCRTAHMAGPNQTDDPRLAHVVIFIDAETTYTGAEHAVIEPGDFKVGDRIEGERFPATEQFAAAR